MVKKILLHSARFAFAFLVGGLLLIPSHAYAALYSGDVVTIEDEVNENIYVTAGKIDIKADVVGDVFAMGGEISIEGTISGDISAAGGSITIRGMAEDIRIAGGEVKVDHISAKDLIIAGGTVKVGDVLIDGDASLTAGELQVAGEYKKDLHIQAGTATFAAKVDGNVRADVDTMEISEDAVISNNLEYASTTAIAIPDGVVKAEVSQFEKQGWKLDLPQVSLYAILTYLIFSASFGAFFIVIFGPNFIARRAQYMKTLPIESFGNGIAFLVFVPLLALGAMSLVAGVPFGFLILGLYALVLFSLPIFLPFFLGSIVLNVREDHPTRLKLFMSAVAGAAIMSLILLVPIFGFFVAVLLGVITLGGLFQDDEKYMGIVPKRVK